MKFNSQICTTKEQSERLLALGLKKETADMTYLNNKICAASYNEMECPYDNLVKPAWSLHRLIEILGVSKMFFNMDFYDSPYEEIIRRIDVFIHTGVFNEEYLEG